MDNIAGYENQRKSKFLINTISIVVPLVVAGLLALPNKLDFGEWTKNLSHVIGLINSRDDFGFNSWVDFY